MSGIQVHNLSGVMKALTLDVDKAEKAGIYALTQVALAVERRAKINAAQGGTHARDEKTGARPGSGPARVTGALQASIFTELRKGFGVYVAAVYPTMIYARAVELGHPKWASGVNYPYLIPAGEEVMTQANAIFTSAFARKWRP